MTNRDLLEELPAELICKIVQLLPIADRARLEAVSKRLHRLSLDSVTSLDFKLTSKLDVNGLGRWMKRLSSTPSQSSLQSLQILLGTQFLPKPASGFDFWATTFPRSFGPDALSILVRPFMAASLVASPHTYTKQDPVAPELFSCYLVACGLGSDFAVTLQTSPAMS